MASSSTEVASPESSVRERIIAAARAEFAANGLRGSSVRSIGARAGVTAAMINYYYGSKVALYDLVVEQAQARFFARVSTALEGGDRVELPARLTGAYFDFLSEEREFQQLLLREVLDRGEGVPAFVRKYVAPVRTLLEGLFGGGDDSFQIAVSLFGAVAGYFLYEPVLSELVGEHVLDEERLARRRQHVVELATLLAQSHDQG